ncbi:MAG: ArnT family glycosyltransferase, partial [Halodesulfurarchaeum sp.]
MESLPSAFRHAIEVIQRDLRKDPYLRYILLLAFVLGAFWFWHRIPNVATRDELSRLLETLVIYASVLGEPSFESLQAGVEWGRAPFGATTYLYGVLLLPVILAAVALGDGGAIANIAFPDWAFGHYEAWAGTPEWIWAASISIVRLANVAFAVGSVYLVYRIGTTLADRTVGRLASLLLALTWGVQTLAHEGGEDMPATFFVVLTVVLLLAYLRSGDRLPFLAASAAGGLAIGFKLTAAPVIPLIGLAYLLRLTRSDESGLERYRPKLVVAGAVIGLVVIFLSFPRTAVGHVDQVIERIWDGSATRADWATGPDAPIWWWFLRQYLNGLGLGLFAGAVLGVAGSIRKIARGDDGRNAAILLVGAVALYVVLFSQWHDFRTHHLLPTFPFLAVLIAWPARDLLDRAPRIGRVAVAVLLVTSGLYVGVGVAQYAEMPRDQAVEWLETNAEDDDVIEVYRRHVQDTAVPYSMTVNYAYDMSEEDLEPCPAYIQLGYRDLLYLDPTTYYRNDPEKADYTRGLLEGEYNYEIVAEFGPRPPKFVPERPTPGVASELLRTGLLPHTDQYA